MKCPGQDMQYWDAEAIFEVDCPECGAPVEFYKDDTSRKCSGCGHRFVNPRMDFGCAAYCRYAAQCLGTLPEEFVGARDNLLKDKVAVQMKRYFSFDFKQIGHVSRIARYAEKIAGEENANLAVILCAAYLSSMGRREAELKQEDPAPDLICRECLVVAASTLGDLGAKEEIVRDVCSLIETHFGDRGSTCPEELVLTDALRAAHLEEEQKEHPRTPGELEKVIASRLLTDGGRRVVRSSFTETGLLEPPTVSCPPPS